jgi:hypothetical protein
MRESARRARECIIATEVLKLERRQSLERSQREPRAEISPPKKVSADDARSGGPRCG